MNASDVAQKFYDSREYPVFDSTPTMIIRKGLLSKKQTAWLFAVADTNEWNGNNTVQGEFNKVGFSATKTPTCTTIKFYEHTPPNL